MPKNLSLHRLARSKSQFIAQDLLREKFAARMPTWTFTQYFHQNMELEATPCVKTCVNTVLEESTRRRQEHHAPSNWKQLEHQALGDGLPQKILQAKRKSIFIQILLERNTSGSSTIQQIITSRRARRARILQSSIEQSMCKIW